MGLEHNNNSFDCKEREPHINGSAINGNAKNRNDVNTNAIDGRSNENSSRKLIGIDGTWYDVTSFLSHHPGGSVINMFVGEDATSVFNSIHKGTHALKRVKPCGTYTINRTGYDDKVTSRFEQLHEEFRKEGFFDTSGAFYARVFALTLLFFLASWVCVLCSDSALVHCVGGVFMFLFWQQCGFMMHDLQHSQMFRSSRHANRVAGSFFGTVCMGVHSMWWFEEHNIHHALTNVVDAQTNFADPQMHEVIWAQNTKLFPLFTGLLQYCMIKIQHLTFIPTVIFAGRVGILIDSYRMPMCRREIVCVALHWIWMSLMLFFLPTWYSVAVFYITCSVLEGSFHFQLILSHYCKEFHDKHDLHYKSWHVAQVVSNINIDIPWWMDWYFGGLNLHIEHHLFPRMSRHKLREASHRIKAICSDLGILYESKPFFLVLWETVINLKLVGAQYKLSLM